MSYQTDLEQETLAHEELARLAAELAKVIWPIWQLGDGCGGHVRYELGKAFAKAGLPINWQWGM